VLWVHASNTARFEQSCRDIADKVKIAGRHDPKANIFKLVHDWLQDGKRTWVLILDNVDDARFLIDDGQDRLDQCGGSASRPLRDYLPQSQNGSILITSRSQEAASKLVEEKDIINIGPMSESDALALLRKKLGKQDNQGSTELVVALEFMPLAIVQAAAYISQRAPRCSIRQYLEEFQKSDGKKTSLLNYEGRELRRDGKAKNSIIITWQISFDHIWQTKPSAADLLSLMSLFDRQGIPETLLRDRAETDDRPQNEDAHRGKDNFEDEEDHISQLSESEEFEDSIVTLRNYSFISIGTDGRNLEMHSLVQLATRKWLEANGQLEKWKQQYIKNLSAVFPTGEFENWDACRALFPHAKSATKQRPEGRESLRNWAMILYRAAWYAWKKGNWADAEKLAIKAMKTREKLLGSEDKATLASMVMVGLIYQHQGRWKEAEELNVQVIETSKRVLGHEHPDTLTSMANLASTYLDQGRWKEAEELNVQVMETFKRMLGHEHPDTLTSMANLAVAYMNQGRWKEAAELNVQVMETRKRVLGHEHPDTLTSIANLASTLWNQGQWKDAEELNVQVMEIRKRMLGHEHPDTLTSMNNLAFTWNGQGQSAEALKLMEECVQLRTRILGATHPDTVSSSEALLDWKTDGPNIEDFATRVPPISTSA
jgi:Tetratricopeptide repeat